MACVSITIDKHPAQIIIISMRIIATEIVMYMLFSRSGMKLRMKLDSNFFIFGIIIIIRIRALDLGCDFFDFGVVSLLANLGIGHQDTWTLG